MQRYIYLLTMLLITASLSACGGGDGGDEGSDGGNDAQSTSPAEDDSSSDSSGSGSSQNYTLNGLSGVNGKDARNGRGSGVNITLFNGGVDTSHQELADTKITGKYDVTSNDNAGVTHDVTGIGTYLAGLTLGKNIGVAPAANLNIVRVFRDPANGIDQDASADALNYTVNNFNTDVLLITYDVADITASDFSFALEDNAASKDWIVVITGGNVPAGASRRGVYGFASAADDPEYAGHMIVVGATDGQGELLANSPAAYEI